LFPIGGLREPNI